MVIRGGCLFAILTLDREGGSLSGGGRLLERGRLFEEIRYCGNLEKTFAVYQCNA